MIFRGAIYEIHALPGATGHEQQGGRLAVVIQSDQFASSTVTVAMTSTRAARAVYRPEIDVDGQRRRIITDQVFSVDPSRLAAFRGALDAGEIGKLDRALLLKFGLL